MAVDKKGTKQIAANKKAWHDYFVEEKYRSGHRACGYRGKVHPSWDRSISRIPYRWFKDGEILVRGMHISPYEKGNIFNKDPLRVRKLLMHKREIVNLFSKTKQDGYSVIPLAVYFKSSRVKVEIGLCKGKKLHDKRDSIAARDAKREMDRAMKERNR